jgi:hypothetical protein
MTYFREERRGKKYKILWPASGKKGEGQVRMAYLFLPMCCILE